MFIVSEHPVKSTNSLQGEAGTMKKKRERLAEIGALVGIVGGVLGIVAALSGSKPIFSWIALCLVIAALTWYFAEGLRGALVITLLGIVGVAAIGVALWLGPVTVEITVYIDQNGNGIQDGGEPPVGPGMVLEMLDSNGVTRIAVTDDRGTATFPNVPQGPYGLQFGAPGISGKAVRLSTDIIVPISPTVIPPTLTVTPSPVPSAIPTTPQTAVVSPTPQCSDDLISCSVKRVNIFAPGKSSLTVVTAPGGLVISFSNDQTGSGLAFMFAPPLNVQGFRHLEITGTSVETCTFVIEYKIRSDDKLTTVTTSDFETFDGAAAATQKFRIPMAYNGEIDEMVINFYNIGEASTVVIESIQLSP
jgi:SdrD B-like domain